MRHEVPKTGGIYRILNEKTGKFYIGSAKNCRRRSYEHFSMLERGIHPCVPLQRSWNKHSAACFRFEVIACVPKTEDLISVEQSVLDAFPTKQKYNCLRFAHSSLGYRHSDEAKQRIREARQMQVMSPETIAKRAKSHVGIKLNLTDKERQLRRDRMKRVNASLARTDEYRTKIAETLRRTKREKGKPFICDQTQETFTLTTDAADKYGVPYKSIWRVLSGERTHTHGLSFHYV